MEVFGTNYPTVDGTCVRDYIHVKDLARAHVSALSHLRAGGKSDVFNCGYGTGYSVNQVIAAVKKASGVDFTVKQSPRRPGDPAAVVASSDKIRHQLGWKPEHANLDTIVTQALNWEKHLAQFKLAS
jgi:UDP-glucose 4-epimerase